MPPGIFKEHVVQAVLFMRRMRDKIRMGEA